MNPSSRSSSEPRPLGPADEKGILDIAGANGGPIRLPIECSEEFIEAFNRIYKPVALRIGRAAEP